MTGLSRRRTGPAGRLVASPWLRAQAAYLAVMALIGWWMSGYYMWQSHDGWYAAYRVWLLAQLWTSGEWGAMHWLPQLIEGYGYPMFLFYPPLAYGIAAGGVTLLGLPAGAATKLSFWAALTLSGLFVLLLGRTLARRRPCDHAAWWSLAAALMYALAPYHMVDTFVRGSLVQCWAWAAFAAVVWSVELARTRPLAGFAAVAFSSKRSVWSSSISRKKRASLRRARNWPAAVRCIVARSLGLRNVINPVNSDAASAKMLASSGWLLISVAPAMAASAVAGTPNQ